VRKRMGSVVGEFWRVTSPPPAASASFIALTPSLPTHSPALPRHKNSFLPTNHGMDEFFGNLYHLNAEEEPEHEDYPTDADFPEFKKKFGPRGVMHTFADGRVEDTGPLTKKRMETIDIECADKAIDFIKRTVASGNPFYVWVNTTHMHFRTHAAPHERGLSGRWMSEYTDVMVSHSKLVGRLLDALDEMGLTDNTVVMYSTDNGEREGARENRERAGKKWEGEKIMEDG
jgi:arylsulfatase